MTVVLLLQNTRYRLMMLNRDDYQTYNYHSNESLCLYKGFVGNLSFYSFCFWFLSSHVLTVVWSFSSSIMSFFTYFNDLDQRDGLEGDKIRFFYIFLFFIIINHHHNLSILSSAKTLAQYCVSYFFFSLYKANRYFTS